MWIHTAYAFYWQILKALRVEELKKLNTESQVLEFRNTEPLISRPQKTQFLATGGGGVDPIREAASARHRAQVYPSLNPSAQKCHFP